MCDRKERCGGLDSDDACTNQQCEECLKIRGTCALSDRVGKEVILTLDTQDTHTKQLLRKTKAELVQMILDYEVRLSDKDEALTIFQNKF